MKMEKGDAVIICKGIHKGKYAEIKEIRPGGTITVTMAEIVITGSDVKTKVTELTLASGHYRKDEKMSKKIKQLIPGMSYMTVTTTKS